MSRKSFLKTLGAAWASLYGMRAAHAGGAESPFFGLAASLRAERRYRARIEGRLPAGLAGVLYRNGPGLFERDGYRKQCLLDGDGMIQAFRIRSGEVEYENRFVRTPKFLEEEKAGRFLYKTWTTLAPGFLSNIGVHMPPSAGVNVFARGKKLYAVEDFSYPFRLDADSLATLGADRFGLKEAFYSAHPKVETGTNDFIHFGIEGGPTFQLHITELDAGDQVRNHRRFALPEPLYIHDFFVTKRYIVFNLHPARVSLLGFLAGTRSFARSFDWVPSEGNILLVFTRGGPADEKPKRFEAPACWMWHSINAYDRGDEIVADFVGFYEPDHFIGENAALWQLMEGRMGAYQHPGKIRRYVLSPRSETAHAEILDSHNHEFPTVAPSVSCVKHRYSHLARGNQRGFPMHEIVRFDHDTGVADVFDFGQDSFYVGEPVFAPDPARRVSEDGGWLLSIVYHHPSQKSFLAVLDAQRVADGPVAKVWLEHHSPISFHGCWQAGAA